MTKLITLDIETFYGDGYSLSLKDMTTEKYIRDERFKLHGFGVSVNFGPARWVTGRLAEQVLRKLDIENSYLIGHNLQFDGFILAEKYGIYPKMYIDTLALSRAIIGPHLERHGLKYVAEKLCGMTKMDELAKAYNYRDLPKHIEEKLADYTVGEPRWNEVKQLTEAGDVVLTNAIFKKLIVHFPQSELLALDWTIRAFTDPKLYLDADMLEEYIRELAERKQQALDKAGLSSRDLLMSNQQYAAALEAMGVTPPTKINAKGKVTFAFAKTDEAHKALLEHENLDVQAIVAARLEHKSTIEETRAALYLGAATRGPWPVAYNYAGATVTQRLSGNKGGGGNPQNLKRGGTLRRAIYAPPGYVLGVADLSQIECRITLWIGSQLTGEGGEEYASLEVMRAGGDIYGYFGTKIYGVEITKKTYPAERQVSKSAVLGLGFGMGVPRFVEYCKQQGVKGVDESFAANIINLYRGTYVGVKKFWGQCNKAINMLLEGVECDLPFEGTPLVHVGFDPLFKQPGIRLPNGLWIKYPGLQKDPEGQLSYMDGNSRVKLFGGKICENIVQAIAAELLREQLVEINRYYQVVMTTHDEIVCLVRSDEEGHTDGAEFKDFVQQVMTREPKYLPGIPLAIEVDLAERYGDAKQ